MLLQVMTLRGLTVDETLRERWPAPTRPSKAGPRAMTATSVVFAKASARRSAP